MNFDKLMAPLAGLLPPETLAQSLELPCKIMGEKPNEILPSTILGSGGVALSKLLLVTNRFICEIRLPGPPQGCDFDISPKTALANYRVTTWVQDIRQEEKLIASYQIAQVILVHSTPMGFRTELSYAGGNVDEWLSRVVAALPPSEVL